MQQKVLVCQTQQSFCICQSFMMLCKVKQWVLGYEDLRAEYVHLVAKMNYYHMHKELICEK